MAKKSLSEYIILLRNIKEPSIRQEILAELRVNFADLIKSSDDLREVFVALSRKEVTVFYNQFKTQILGFISTMDHNTTMVSFKLSPEHMKEIYFHLKDRHGFKASTVAHYYQLLMSIRDPSIRQEILAELKVNFADLMKSIYDVREVFLALTDKEITVFFNQFKMQILGLVSTVGHMNLISLKLSQDHSKELYFHLKNKHGFKISTAADYNKVLMSIKEPSIRQEILAELRVNFAELIKSSDDLREVFDALTRKEATVFYNKFKTQILGFISTMDHNTTMVSFKLSPEHMKEIYFHLKDRHGFKASTVAHYYHLLMSIKEPSIRQEILAELKVNFADLMKSIYDVREVFLALTDKEATVFYNHFKTQILGFISTVGHMNLIVSKLSQKQIQEILTHLSIEVAVHCSQPEETPSSTTNISMMVDEIHCSQPEETSSSTMNINMMIGEVHSSQPEETPLSTMNINMMAGEVHSSQPEEIHSSKINISMMVLGGFIAAAGIAAVAIAFTVLNAATFGVAGLVVAGIGVTAVISGVGLFARGSYKYTQQTTCENSLDYPCPG